MGFARSGVVAVLIGLLAAVPAANVPVDLLNSPAGVQASPVIDPRIDVQAQRSMMRMLASGGDHATAASEMLSAVKAELLAGIYQQDQQKPALRAQKIGKGWWQLFQGQPANRLAFCWLEPPGVPPMIVMRKGVTSSLTLDGELALAWEQCQISAPPSEPSGTSPQPFGSSSSGQPTQSGSRTLTVKVLDGSQPLRDIDVFLFRGGQPVQQDARKTGSAGQADFGRLETGPYVLRVYGPVNADGRPKYAPAVRHIDFNASRGHSETIVLIRAGYSDTGPMAELEVRVVEEVFVRYSLRTPPSSDETAPGVRGHKGGSIIGPIDWHLVSTTRRAVRKDARMTKECDGPRGGTAHYRRPLQRDVMRLSWEEIVLRYKFDPPPEGDASDYRGMPSAAEDIEEMHSGGSKATPPCPGR